MLEPQLDNMTFHKREVYSSAKKLAETPKTSKTSRRKTDPTASRKGDSNLNCLERYSKSCSKIPHPNLNFSRNPSTQYTTLRISPKISSLESPSPPDKSISLALKCMPALSKVFDLKKKVGEGSFAKVFQISLLSNPDKEFALKFLLPVVKPFRFLNELRYLRDMGGQDNIMSAEVVVLKDGFTVVVMPYFPHDGFTSYLSDLSTDEVRDYMFNLLLALRRIHSKGVIHRDVKPNNFLYDRSNRRFALIDFGLAQRQREVERTAGIQHQQLARFGSVAPQIEQIAQRARQAGKSNVVIDTAIKNSSASKILAEKPSSHNTQSKTSGETATTVTDVLITSDSKKPFLMKIKRKSDSQLNEQESNSNKRLRTFPAQPNTQNSESQQLLISSISQPIIQSNKALPDQFSTVFQSPFSPNKETQQMNPDIDPNIINQFKTPVKKRLEDNDIRRSPRIAANKPPISLETPPQTIPRKQICKTPVKSQAPQDKEELQVTPKNKRISITSKMRKKMAEVTGEENSNMVTPRAKAKRKIVVAARKKGDKEAAEMKSMNSQDTSSKTPADGCQCFTSSKICRRCVRRTDIGAPRAGTPGFRAPEVLMKYLHQTPAIDIWSAGVIFIAMLAQKYPFFRNVDDLTSLAEVIEIFGTESVLNVSNQLNKQMTICAVEKAPRDLAQLCCQLRGDRRPDFQPPSSAYDLLGKLLDPNPKTRISAEEALSHPYFTGN